MRELKKMLRFGSLFSVIQRILLLEVIVTSIQRRIRTALEAGF